MRTLIRLAFVLVFQGLLLLPGCRATTPDVTARAFALPAGHSERVMTSSVDGKPLAYLLDVPDGEPPGSGWPLVLFLHGAGERGDDLSLVMVHGPPRLLEEIPELSRCVLVSPQCPKNSWWRPAPLLALVDEVCAGSYVDPSRLYVTGLSMGGYGSWGLLAEAPGRFAAAVPICGGGDAGRLWPGLATGFELEDLLRARDVPVRAFHGEDDRVVPVGESRLLVEALREAGAPVEFTVYPGVGHDAWTRTYSDPTLWSWLFAQRREDEAP